MEVDEPLLARWSEALTVIADGIEAGVFVARPGDDMRYAGFIGCDACDPDGLGTADLQRRWDRKRRSPELAAYLRLLGEPTDDADDADEWATETAGPSRPTTRRPAVAEVTVTAPAPPDAGERARIVDELDATLFVEAGAGSGKTRSLVDRIVALVTRAAVPMGQIAAITFTDKAAAELRDRVRRELEAVERHGDEVAAAGARQALHDLDGAAVSTLHAFAQRLLTEQPLQAGLPPRVEVADEVASQLAFDDRWAAFVDGLLDDEALAAAPDDEQALLLLLEVRKPIEALRDVALEFERNWDLVAEQVVGMPVPPVQLLDVRGHRRRGARGCRRARARGRGRQARGRPCRPRAAGAPARGGRDAT